MENNLSWKPRLKQGTKRATPSTETTRMAALALDNMKKVERRRIDGTLDQEYLEKISGKKIEKLEKKPWNKLLLAIPAATILVLLGLCLFSSRGHNISGIVRKNRFPLSRAEVTLRGERSYETTADDQGKFSLLGIEPGNYKLTVEGEIDPAYADVNKTPLAINVTRDIENILVQTYSNMPKQKKPTWKPGID